jgi:hypothetical protein
MSLYLSLEEQSEHANFVGSYLKELYRILAPCWIWILFNFQLEHVLFSNFLYAPCHTAVSSSSVFFLILTSCSELVILLIEKRTLCCTHQSMVGQSSAGCPFWTSRARLHCLWPRLGSETVILLLCFQTTLYKRIIFIGFLVHMKIQV